MVPHRTKDRKASGIQILDYTCLRRQGFLILEYFFNFYPESTRLQKPSLQKLMLQHLLAGDALASAGRESRIHNLKFFSILKSDPKKIEIILNHQKVNKKYYS